jgi:hypothetical protein
MLTGKHINNIYRQTASKTSFHEFILAVRYGLLLSMKPIKKNGMATRLVSIQHGRNIFLALNANPIQPMHKQHIPRDNSFFDK